MSSLADSNNINAVAVRTSKLVAPMLDSELRSSTIRRASLYKSSTTGLPFIMMESRTEIRCGLLNLPTVNPLACNIEATSAETLPFPLVPVIWIVGRVYCGRCESRTLIRSSERFMVGHVEAQVTNLAKSPLQTNPSISSPSRIVVAFVYSERTRERANMPVKKTVAECPQPGPGLRTPFPWSRTTRTRHSFLSRRCLWGGLRW